MSYFARISAIPLKRGHWEATVSCYEALAKAGSALCLDSRALLKYRRRKEKL
jgi:hypothetical protein